MCGDFREADLFTGKTLPTRHSKKTKLWKKTSIVGWPPTGFLPSAIGSQIGSLKESERDSKRDPKNPIFVGIFGFSAPFKLGLFGFKLREPGKLGVFLGFSRGKLKETQGETLFS